MSNKPCPNCDGELSLLGILEVWLCDRNPDHCWPADEWPVDEIGKEAT